MIEVEQFDWGLRVVDAAKNQVEIEIDDWEAGGELFEIERHVEERIAGYASEIRIPGQTVVIESTVKRSLIHLQVDEEVHLPVGKHTIQIDDGIATYIVTNEELWVSSCLKNSTVRLSFNNLSKVAFGVRSHIRYPSSEIEIPRTITAIASAISTFGESHLTESPDRSYPSLRGHPPLIFFSDSEVNHQESTRLGTKDINICVPESLTALYMITPLAYYLDASVEVTHTEIPLIETRNYELQFSTCSEVWHEAAKLFKKVFYLDCLVRSAGPHGIITKEVELLEEFDIDPSEVYRLPMDERFESYAEIPIQEGLNKLPQWPFSASIKSTFENAIALPYLANNMAILYPPKSILLSPRDRLEKSLDNYDRGQDSDSVQSNLVEPTISEGSIHGWFGDNVAISAFNGLSGSLNNRFDLDEEVGTLPIYVILNDEKMEDESNQAIAEYVNRFRKAGAQLEFYQNISTDHFAHILEKTSAFLHYIGHCENGKLLCDNGYVSPNNLGKAGAQSFFINACNSYQFGEDLVDLGSVAGVVTLGKVLENQANVIGTTFARLVSTGLTISQSLDLAKSKSLVNHQYAIVGDGTFCISQGGNNTPEVIHVWEGPNDKFLIDEKSVSPMFHGSVYQSETSTVPGLQGNSNPHFISSDKLDWLLEISDSPCIFGGELLWPEELKGRLGDFT